MKTYRKPAGGVLAVLTFISLFLWSAWAQDASDSGSVCGYDAGRATRGACPGSGRCPVTGACPAIDSGVSAGQTRCPFMNVQINRALMMESSGQRVHSRCPRREGVVGKYPRKSSSIRPQFNI